MTKLANIRLAISNATAANRPPYPTFRRAGIAAPDQVFGLAWSGAMRASRLIGILSNLPKGLTEIYMHPARGTFPGSAPDYEYRAELAALIDPRMPGLIASGDIRLGGFSDFPVH